MRLMQRLTVFSLELHPASCWPDCKILVAVAHNSSLLTVAVFAGNYLSEKILRILNCGPGAQPSRTDLTSNITPLTEEIITL